MKNTYKNMGRVVKLEIGGCLWRNCSNTLSGAAARTGRGKKRRINKK